MAVELPPDAWFLIGKGRFWAIRREGNILMAKLAGLTVVFGFGAIFLAGLVHWAVGVGAGIIGVAWSQWWFSRLRKQHTDHSISYFDYLKAGRQK